MQQNNCQKSILVLNINKVLQFTVHKSLHTYTYVDLVHCQAISKPFTLSLSTMRKRDVKQSRFLICQCYSTSYIVILIETLVKYQCANVNFKSYGRQKFSCEVNDFKKIFTAVLQMVNFTCSTVQTIIQSVNSGSVINEQRSGWQKSQVDVHGRTIIKRT